MKKFFEIFHFDICRFKTFTYLCLRKLGVSVDLKVLSTILETHLEKLSEKISYSNMSVLSRPVRIGSGGEDRHFAGDPILPYFES